MMAWAGLALALAGGAGAEADAERLDAIVVTAQKREQRADDVAAALTVVGGDALRTRGIARMQDLAQAMPSLEVEPAFGSQQLQFRLRGVGFLDYMTNNSSPVGVAVDGVGLAFPVQAAAPWFDLERVEVLRGPQGTLYGRNTVGGSVNLVTAAPQSRFGAGVQVDAGQRDERRVEAFATGALGEPLRGRVALLRATGGAWQHERERGEELGDADVLALRTRLDADLGEAWQAALRVQHARDRSDGFGLQLLAPFQPAFGGAPIAADRDRGATGWGLRPDFAQRLGLDAEARPGRDNRGDAAALTLTRTGDQLRFTAVAAVDRLRRREYGDYDATPYAESDQVFVSDIRTASQELRLESIAPGPWRWTAGLHAARDDLDEASHVDLTRRLGGELVTEYRQDARTSAAFAQLERDLAARWRVVAGLRHDRERRRLRDFVTRFVVPPVPFAGPADRATSDAGDSGRLALEWRGEDAALWYASLARGFKSGGFTAHNTADLGALAPFAPETLVAWETGWKRGSGAWRVEAALFHYDYRDQQVYSAYFEPLSQSLTGLFVNAPRARLQGAEVEATWSPDPGWSLSQFVAWKRGRFTAPFVTFDPVASLEAGDNVFRDYDGRALDVPRWHVGGRVARAFDTAHGRFEAALDYGWRSRQEQTLLLGDGYALDARWIANLQFEWTPPACAWSLGAWVRNAGDESYDLTRNYFLPGTPVAARGAPRSAGLRWSWRY